ncbi:MAG: hypothetical protein F6K41_21030 [Symploca sp. SIO3E6]|nr:hypothetical protein [Caldora sp. SIO3E6]
MNREVGDLELSQLLGTISASWCRRRSHFIQCIRESDRWAGAGKTHILHHSQQAPKPPWN